MPALDSQNDVTLISGTDDGTTTIISFSRKLVTGDTTQDLVISDTSPTYVIWAIVNLIFFYLNIFIEYLSFLFNF